MTQSGDSVIVAVSGGPDSMTLLSVLLRLAPEMGLRLIAAHLDHGLRPESGAEARFVTRWCKEWDTPVITRRENIRRRAAEMGLSLEETGRRIRYAFLEECRIATKSVKSATGHHADDSIETFFLRITRGTSLNGLGGAAPIRGAVIRPLIFCERREIERYVQVNAIPHVVDASNLESTTDRNFIRNEIIPRIEAGFPHFRKALRRTMRLIEADNRILEELAEALIAAAAGPCEDGIQLDVETIRAAPETISSRALLKLFYQFTGSPERWTSLHLKEGLRLFHGCAASARVILPGRLQLTRVYEKVILSRPQPTPEQWRIEILDDRPAEYTTPEGQVRIRHMNPESIVYAAGDKNVAYFDPAALTFPLMLRNRRDGDRIRPWGIDGEIKLKKLFIDLKIPRRAREAIPLLISSGIILWALGIRRGRHAAVTPATTTALEVRWEAKNSKREEAPT